MGLGAAVRVGVGVGADARVLVGLTGWGLPGVGWAVGKLAEAVQVAAARVGWVGRAPGV